MSSFCFSAGSFHIPVRYIFSIEHHVEIRLSFSSTAAIPKILFRNSCTRYLFFYSSIFFHALVNNFTEKNIIKQNMKTNVFRGNHDVIKENDKKSNNILERGTHTRIKHLKKYK